MNGKQLVIATMFASVLLAVIFIPTSTNSQPSTQAVAPYDPWADINEDGKIDIKDLAYSAARYGTLGDPAKNVSVTNWPAQSGEFSIDSINVTWSAGSTGIWVSVPVSVKYSRIFFSMYPVGVQAGVEAWIYINLSTVFWFGSNFEYAGNEGANHQIIVYRHDTTQFKWWWPSSAAPYEIVAKAPIFEVGFTITSAQAPSGWVLLNYYVYERNE